MDGDTIFCKEKRQYEKACMNRKTNHLRQEEEAYEKKTEKREDEEEQLPVDRRETSCRLIGYQRCQSLAQQDLAGNRLNAHEISSPSWPLLSGE
ncbi:hypothetical protein T10_1179 [Trichinella papuae]|uniref:Uncharacterized protein n=1 Tax=Trichinella papuae TaxID=268474 RepID=A0A0V1M7C3_9BILA|nr:hypothetical protein T10_1179 [Trichinella papuae]